MKLDLKAEIDIELESMDIVVNDVLNILSTTGNKLPDNIKKTALAAYASQFYNGVENILKRIHKHYEIPLPTVDNWHIQLLQRFSLHSGANLPIKLSQELFDTLNDLRRFRHYFFHGYSVNIDWTILKGSLVDFKALFIDFKDALIKSI